MDNNGRYYANNDWCYEQCRRRQCRGMYHMIRQGDTLYSLSRQYKVSVDAIIRANPGVNIYNLHINDELCIPIMLNNNNTPPDYTFDYIDDEFNNSNRQDEFSMFDDEMVETESNKQTNYFSENDSVKDMLEKTGMTMAELLECINRR